MFLKNYLFANIYGLCYCIGAIAVMLGFFEIEVISPATDDIKKFQISKNIFKSDKIISIDLKYYSENSSKYKILYAQNDIMKKIKNIHNVLEAYKIKIEKELQNKNKTGIKNSLNKFKSYLHDKIINMNFTIFGNKNERIVANLVKIGPEAYSTIFKLYLEIGVNITSLYDCSAEIVNIIYKMCDDIIKAGNND